MPLAPADHARTIAFVDSANWGPTSASAEREWSGLLPARERSAAIWIVRGSPAARSHSLDPSAGTGVAPAG